jgi:hypothetical protein
VPKHLSPALQEEIDIIIATYWLRRDEASRHTEKTAATPLYQPGTTKPFALTLSNINKKLFAIEQELKIFYQIDTTATISSDIPRVNFLRQHHAAFADLQTRLTPKEKQLSTSMLIELEATKLNMFLDVTKKIIDIFDDVWYLALLAIRKNITPTMFNLINAFMTAFIGSMVLVAEAVNGLQVAQHAYWKNNHHREAHIAAGLLIFATGMTGLGLSVALCLGTLGAPVISLDLLPIIIPSLLVVIYSIEMLRDAYIFRQAQKADSAAEHKVMKLKPYWKIYQKIRRVMIKNSVQAKALYSITSQPMTTSAKNA